MERRDINNHGERSSVSRVFQQPYVETVASFWGVDGWAVPTWSGGSRSLD